MHAWYWVICYHTVVSKYKDNFRLWITLHILNYLHNYGYPAWTRDGTGRCQLFLSFWGQWIRLKADLQERELHYHCSLAPSNDSTLSLSHWTTARPVIRTPVMQACHSIFRSICPGSRWIWPHCKFMFHINSEKGTRSVTTSGSLVLPMKICISVICLLRWKDGSWYIKGLTFAPRQ